MTSQRNEEGLTISLPSNYKEILRKLKTNIRSRQIKAALSVNRELIAMYMEIGEMLSSQDSTVWGSKTVEHLAEDLREEFPEMKGFSRSNLFSMRQVYQAYKGVLKTVQQLVGQVPWGHNILIVTKLKETSLRQWYLEQTIANGWSRAVLSAQIETALHIRQGAVMSNFQKTLPAPQSDLARQTLKDPYIFDFLSLSKDAVERDLENALVKNITNFLLELGSGFAFLGKQKHLEVEEEDFYLDLLFYHIHLRCYVVIDLKMEKFKPEHTGKMNFYLATVDRQLRGPDDAPSIGLILCKEKKKLIVEYVLSETNRPIGVAQWQLTRELPARLQEELPGPQEIEDAIKLRLERNQEEGGNS